jgi:DNA invertase Pin-like site-specific DNA recombinase
MVTLPPAFSYLRFSSPEQAKGDSVRRQTELRERFLKRLGLPLDDSLVLTDAGVSSFRGRHRGDRYALGRFLALVEAGRVPRGSYLVIENLDRLSREDIQPALLLFLSLLQAGIRIVQLSPAEQVFDDKSESMTIMMAIMELSRGNSESRMKSERVKASWAAKRQRARDGKAATSRCPAWLRREGDGFALVPDKAAAVRRLFELSAAGYGITALIRELVAAGVPPLGTARWHKGTVGQILVNRAAVGEWQPLKGGRPEGEPVPGYFPAVVTEALFHRVQAGLAERSRFRGRTPRDRVNLFQGLLWNAADGDSMFFKMFTDRRSGKKFARYCNRLALDGQAAYTSFPVETLERAVLSSLTEVDPREVLPEDAGRDQEREGRVAALADAEAQLKKIEDRIVAGEEVDVLLRAAKRLEGRRRELREGLAADPGAVREGLWSARSLVTALEAAPDQRDARIRLQAALRRVVERIDGIFLRDGTRQLACLQIRFRDSVATRIVFARYRKEHVTRSWRLPEYAGWSSLRDELPASVDLRQRKWVRAVTAYLRRAVEPDFWDRTWEPDRLPPGPGRPGSGGGRRPPRG